MTHSAINEQQQLILQRNMKTFALHRNRTHFTFRASERRAPGCGAAEHTKKSELLRINGLLSPALSSRGGEGVYTTEVPLSSSGGEGRGEEAVFSHEGGSCEKTASSPRPKKSRLCSFYS